LENDVVAELFTHPIDKELEQEVEEIEYLKQLESEIENKKKEFEIKKNTA